MRKMNNLDQIPILKKGGIHIKKENIGSFTRYCGGNVTQECIERGKNSPNAAIRKKSVFADNARRWKHENGGILKQNIMIPDILKFFNGGGIPMFQNSGVVPGSDINDTEGNYSGGELSASVITPKQSKINRRREIRRAFKSIKNLIKSDNLDSQDVLNAYYGLNESQRKRALESAMKFSPEARPDQVLSMMKQGVLKRPRKAFQTLRYIITGKGEPKFFSYGYNRGYNGLWTINDEEISNGLVDALVYGSPVNSKIGTQADKKDFGPILNYINKYYGNKDVQYIQTNPGVTINQNGITPTSYSGSHGSFKTSTPNAMINNQGFTLEKGTRNDSTFVRGLDVYDFQPNGYNKKWNKNGMHSVVEQVDEDTVPVAIKTPWVPEEDINTILAHPAGYQPYTP